MELKTDLAMLLFFTIEINDNIGHNTEKIGIVSVFFVL